MMNDGNGLDDWLAAARSDLSGHVPDLLAEQQLLSRVREVRALRSVAASCVVASPPRARATGFRRRWLSWRTAAFAGATTLVVGIGFVVFAPTAPQGDAKGRAPFLALVASEAFAGERSASIVSSQVSGAALADYGLPVDPARVDQPIRAEFLVSPTGLVLAVRFTE